jgi:protein-S-isoprenylcysteine O-methyltransferase Ste14
MVSGSTLAMDRTRWREALSAVPLAAWFGFCFARQLPAFAAQWRLDPVDPLALLGGCASLTFCLLWMVLLLARRQRKATVTGLVPRLIAFAGTYLGVGMLLLPASRPAPAVELLSSLLIFAGTFLSIIVLVRLGRSVSVVPEARRLVTRGPYAVIRHPLYLAEGLTLLGITLHYLAPLAVLLFAVQCACQARRMAYEEAVLRAAFPDYAAYAAATPRLLPLGQAIRAIRSAGGYFTRATLGAAAGAEQEKL